MVRIGGKGMTRERDRIQENASKYIIKNCPSILPMTKLCDSESMFNCGTYCKDCTDCVIKQVIEKCKNELQVRNNWWCGAKPLAQEILQLFDIEEIK
jgi:hypothetical protein